MIILMLCVSILLTSTVLYLRKYYATFDKHGVKSITPLPLIGNMANVLLRKEHLVENITRLYKSFPEERFVGRFEFVNGLVMVRDLDLIRKITVKDFEHFIDHRALLNNIESFFSRTLISLKGQEWKDMRSSLSPAFTSSKLRHMVPLIVEVGNQLIDNLRNSIKSSKGGYVDIDCKDLTTRYTNDVIASCAFGLKVDSLKEKNNEFYRTGKTTTTFGYRQMLTIFCILNAPKIADYLKLDFMSQSSKAFFKNLVLDTMKNRDANKIVRHDMIHLLMQLQKGQLKDDIQSDDKTAGFATAEEISLDTKDVDRVWSDNDLVSQAVLFFVAGFDTISTAAIFLLYEIAINPDVQEKLVKEINEHSLKNGHTFDLKSIQEMKYLDMVVSEVLRKWPPAVALDRVCIKDYNMGKPNKNATKDFIIRKGTGINLPVYPIHHDPQYYPDPEKFDPERFSDENKNKINHLAYIPFGSGPRNCIGSRFALAELKVMAYHILQNFEVSPCEKTCIPAKISPVVLNIQLKGGNWLRFKNRK